LQDECEGFGCNILIFLRKTLLDDVAKNGAHWDLFLRRTSAITDTGPLARRVPGA